MLGTKVVVMTSRPGRIANVLNTSFTVQADADNTDEIKALPEFIEVRKEIHRSM